MFNRFMRRLNALLAIIHAIRCTRYGYVVYVPEYNGLHYTMDRVEYVRWIRAYPKDCTMYCSAQGELVVDY